MVCRMAKVLKLDKTTWALLVMIVGPVESFAVFLIGHYLSDVALASALIALVTSIAGILIWYFNAEEQQAPGNPPIPSTNSMPTNTFTLHYSQSTVFYPKFSYTPEQQEQDRQQDDSSPSIQCPLTLCCLPEACSGLWAWDYDPRLCRPCSVLLIAAACQHLHRNMQRLGQSLSSACMLSHSQLR